MSELRHTDDGLAYEVGGSGPAVLLIHEGIADRTMWDPQWERWSDRFTLIRYDQRGFGESDDPAAEFSRHGDALAVLDAAGVDRARVVGASMGGAAALDLTLAAPDRVAALVAVVATPSGWEHSADLLARFEEVDAAYERGGLEAANEVELRMWVDGENREPAEVDPALRSKVAGMNYEALERDEAREQRDAEVDPTELDPPAVGRLAEVALPVLVVTGALDQPSVNAGAAAMAAGIQGAQAIEIAEAAHLPSLERPEAFDAAVVPFLDAAAAAGRS
jgi:pimeloyl-ACP methyl ester carboxylesterase